jgi:hypothetical protein
MWNRSTWWSMATHLKVVRKKSKRTGAKYTLHWHKLNYVLCPIGPHLLKFPSPSSKLMNSLMD